MLKAKILLLFFISFFILIIIRLFYLQVLSSKNNNNDYLQTRKIIPERGKIFDINGQPLALNDTSYLMYFEPKKIQNRDEIIRKVDSILNIGEATIEAKIDDSKDWVAVKSNLTKEERSKILEFKLNGIGFDPIPQRSYPEASLAAHILGFVGKNDTGDSVGYFGVEGFYDKDLAGLPGILNTERDLIGNPIFIGTQEIFKPENGRDIYLTIDKAVQEIAKEKLKAGIETYKAKDGCVIVADPYTMQIIAMTCLPDFDLSNYWKFTDTDYKNSAISNLYEPGSIFKPLIMSSALNEKKIKPNDMYNETGPVNVGEYSIKTWDNKYEGEISMTRILEKSSNVGMVYVGSKLGNEKLYLYLKKYGFGESTDIDLQGEEAGYLKPIKDWYPIDFATATFGQGINVTQIQMIRAFASIINGGQLLKPYVVNKISYGGNEKNSQKTVIRNTISETNSEVIKKMLLSVVENGEVKWARPKGYSIGGKTGTAQVPIAGRYDSSKTVASFIGFAPYDRPKFLILVSLTQPQTSPWGSETAAPLFFEIAKDLIVYYNIAPDQ